MKLSFLFTSLLALTGLLTPLASADDVFYCPSGKVGDWSWKSDFSFIKLDNPEMSFGWSTGGEPQTAETKGVRIEAFVEDGTRVRSIRIYMKPPEFLIESKNYKAEPIFIRFFGTKRDRPSEESLPAGAISDIPSHDYGLTGFTMEGETARTVFAARKENWKQSVSKEIIAQWFAPGPESLGWPVADQSALSFLLSTPHFKISDMYGQQAGWDNIAKSEPVDLTGMKPALEAAIKGLEAAYANGMATKKFCVKPETASEPTP